MGIIMILKNLIGNHLHVGKRCITKGDGINPICQSHGHRSGRFLDEGEVTIIGPVGNSARPIDQSEFKIGLPRVGLSGYGDLARVVEDLRGRPCRLAQAGKPDEETEDDFCIHGILK